MKNAFHFVVVLYLKFRDKNQRGKEKKFSLIK